MKYRTLGIAGTAKNTGKTTTMAAVMSEIRRTMPDLRVAITSIGYDGEYLDNVTGLPKPRVMMQEGDLAAVSKLCLKYSRAKLEVIEDSGIMSAMGPILIGRITRPGKLVIAGPNKRVEVRQMLSRLKDLGADLTIVDGALGRIVPMCEVESLILATGASRHADIPRLAEEARCMSDVLAMPAMEAPEVSVNPILTQDDADTLFRALKAKDSVLVRGLIGPAYLQQLAEHAEEFSGKSLVLETPISLLPAGDLPEMHNSLMTIQQKGITLGTTKPVRLVAVTVNPYYPRYRYNRNDYEPAYVDREELHKAITDAVTAPVFDVVHQGASGLLKLLQ